MELKEDLILHETAIAAQEKGFKYKKNLWDIDKDNFDELPTQSLLRKWLRRVHKIHIDLFFDDNTWQIRIGTFTIPDFAPDIIMSIEEKSSFEDSINAYEEALELGLLNALKLIVK